MTAQRNLGATAQRKLGAKAMTAQPISTKAPTHLVTPVPIIHREKPCPIHTRREGHVTCQVHGNCPVLHVGAQVLLAVGPKAPAAVDPEWLRVFLLGRAWQVGRRGGGRGIGCRFNECVRTRPKTKLIDQGQSHHAGVGCPTSAVKTLFVRHLCHLPPPPWPCTCHCITVAATGHCIAMRGFKAAQLSKGQTLTSSLLPNTGCWCSGLLGSLATPWKLTCCCCCWGESSDAAGGLL